MFFCEKCSGMSRRYGLVILFAVIYSSLYLQLCDGQSNARGNRRGHRQRNDRRGPGGMHPEVHQAYLDVYQQQPRTTQSSPFWAALAPSVPVGDDIECYVEIVQVRQRGGRCIQLGGNASRPYICQSGDQIEFNPNCYFIIQRRLLQQDAEPQN